MTAPANPLAVIDKAAQRAIEERDQHDANGAPEYADSWESLRGELREVRATVEMLDALLDEATGYVEAISNGTAKHIDPVAAEALAARMNAALAALRGEA